MAFTEDLDAFFSTDDFGDVGTFTLAGQAAKDVDGIFDGPGVIALGGYGVETTAPHFLCSAAEVDGIAHGDLVTINDTAYTIKGVDPDGTGLVDLKLQAAT